MSSVRFGKAFEKVWPVDLGPPQWTDEESDLLQQCTAVEKPTPMSVPELIEASSAFPIKFPINSCRVITQSTDRHERIGEQIASAYPVINECVLRLYVRFLLHKQKFGTAIERNVYANMNVVALVQRLLTKRCIAFFGGNDKYLLISGEQGASGFVEIGQAGEKPPLILADCLSYDEIKLSALLSVSSYTFFINNGTRNNCGIVEPNLSKIETEGVIVGAIGARLKRRDQMEFQEIVIAKSQNQPARGYGLQPISVADKTLLAKYEYRKLWSSFYEEPSLLFSDVSRDELRFRQSKNKMDHFDCLLMKKRYTISFDTLLLEAQARSEHSGKIAYIHVVGLGLGVWKACREQEELFFDVFEQRLKVLRDKLSRIGYVHFSWFELESRGELKNGHTFKFKGHANGGIKVFLSNRDPSERLTNVVRENTLLVVSYAWDGNALPGNEFWLGMLSSTGDPAAACSSLITELHNPHINRSNVSGENLHILSYESGLLHLADYCRQISQTTKL